MPTIRVDRLTWYLPTLRRAFLGWQRWLNGFELVHADRNSRSFAFRCTHFDAETRRCDSYATRPGLCRDYPRALLAQPWPEFFEGCGYRPLARDSSGLSSAVDATELSPEAKTALRRRLKLD
jgi:Fe-S-cluster containining protein